MKSYKKVGPEGDVFWINKDGKLHRDNGPAVIWYTGIKEWYKNGLRHREDGPAIINDVTDEFLGFEDEDEEDEFFLEDIEYTEKEFINQLRVRKIDSLMKNWDNN